MSEKTVFISYRRETGSSFARSIEQALTKRGYDVFLDVDSIDAGRWASQIRAQVRQRSHFMLLLTPSALQACTDPEDWLRREYELAIDSGRNVVPVRDGTFDVAAARRTCPASMASVFEVQVAAIRHESFEPDIETLVERFIPPHKASAPLAISPEPAEILAARQRYSQRLAAECGVCDYRALAGLVQSQTLVNLTLEATYVEPSLRREEKDSAGADSRPRLLASSLLLEAPRSLVVGEQGTGKSTLLRFLCLRIVDTAAGGSNRLPVRLPSSQIAAALAMGASSLVACARDTLREEGGEPLVAAFEQDLSAGRVVLLLDGLDEIFSEKPRADTIHAIELFALRYPNNGVVVTTRPHAATAIAGNFERFALDPPPGEEARLIAESLESALDGTASTW